LQPKVRVATALRHREPDRVPVGELGCDWEISERVLARPTYYRAKWREYVAEWDGRRDEVVASYARDLPDLARLLGWDFVVAPLVPPRRERYQWPEMLGEYIWRDDAGKVWQYAPESGGHAMLMSAPPLTLADLAEDDFHLDESRLEAIASIVRDIGSSHFVFGRLPDATFPWLETVGMEEFLVRTVTEPAFVAGAIAREMKKALAWLEAMCDLGVDGVVEGADYCDSRGLMFNPRSFRELVLPAIEQLAAAAHARGKFFLKHSDGNNWAILDDFVAAGVDGWQGIQPSLGMDMGLLKRGYAGRLCLFGGVNNETLVQGTPAEVVAEVRDAIRQAGRGGGLVLTCGNTLQIGTRYENYLAMLGAARELGQYPLPAWP
jgi:uroporphyrinogen decarboxylase